MAYQDIIYTKAEGIATITLNRPDRLNAIVPRMMYEMAEALEDAQNDDEVRVVVITGAGRGFCAGADVKEMASETSGERVEELRSVHRMALTLRRCDKPIIAAVNGAAVGAGCDIAMQCDIRIASENARFGEVYVRLGLAPGNGGTYLLPQLVGLEKACELLFTGDIIDAREAERIGLVSRMVPAGELEAATRALATKIAQQPPLAVRAIKRAIRRSLELDFEGTLDYMSNVLPLLRLTEDHREGVRAFAEKRQPQFKGR